MGYKTFEDMKHNIPEGATHYHNESDDHLFCWFKIESGKWFVHCPDEGERWHKCSREHHRSSIVQFLQTESPEEREALDMIDTTSKRVESLVKGDVVEWKNGDNLEYIDGDGEWSEFLGRYISFDEYTGFHVICASDGNIYHVDSEQIRKPESPEQKAERERLEAAIDLHDTFNAKYCEGNSAVLGELGWDSCPDHVRNCYLAIVDKTGYRKESK